jgi:FAD binding domain/Berberine and berberine like
MGSRRAITMDGGECVLSGAAIDRFASKLRGELLTSDHPEYDAVRRVWNGTVDKRPALIARCTGTADVVACVCFAREHELLVSVRGGGHNIAGKSVCEGGLMIDLSRMNDISIDPQKRTARVQGGAKLGDMDRATQAHGLATTAGVVSTTGVAGLTLGGGMGRLGRKHGLACDNLISATVVTADAQALSVSAVEHPDLFWALRGGGANLGIVTSFEFQLHPVGPIVYGGLVFYPVKQASEILKRFDAFCDSAPDEVRVEAVLLTSPEREPVLAISTCCIGPLNEAERLLQPLRVLGSPLADHVAATSYLEIQAAADQIFPTGMCFYWKSHFLKDLSEAAINTILAQFAKVPSPRSAIVLEQWGGAVARMPPDATAFNHRDVQYDFIPASVWTDRADSERQIAWVRQLWEATKPFGTGGVYVNNLGDEGEDRVLAAYGANYEKLAAVKANYDPLNLFRLNQNVQPRL